MGFFPTDVAAQLAPRLSIGPQALTDTVEVDGAGVDRTQMQSAVALASVRFNQATFGASDEMEVVLTLQESSDNGVADDWTDVDSLTETLDISADGDYTALLTLPVNLKPTETWVRLQLVTTFSGTGTVTELVGSGLVVAGGLVDKPNDLHVDAGYAQTAFVAA